MRVTTLKSPGIYSNGQKLRHEACRAISMAEISARKTPGGKTQSASRLAAFFTDCASKLADISDAVVPTVVSRVAASDTQVNITFSEAMDQTVVPAAAAFALPAPDTIDTVAWVSSTVLRLTGTGFAAGESLVYTIPAANAIRDLAGNRVASNTADLT
jgi:hypothetical protein